jgi:hypothetical protein
MFKNFVLPVLFISAALLMGCDDSSQKPSKGSTAPGAAPQAQPSAAQPTAAPIPSAAQPTAAPTPSAAQPEVPAAPAKPMAQPAAPTTMPAAAEVKAAAAKTASAVAPANQALAQDAQAKLTQVMGYIKDNRLDSADTLLKQLEAKKASLPAAIQPKVDQARTALDAAKALGNKMPAIPGLPK